MDRVNADQKKKVIMNYVYCALIGLLVVACAVTIALVNSSTTTQNGVIGDTDLPVSTTTYVLPMKDATVAKDYSGKELQYNETLKQWEIHKAIDFIAGENLEVFAISNGTVANVYTNYLEGTVVEINHANGLVSVYKSLDANVSVKVGDKVSAGQTIGKASTTMAQELNTGAHLHLEILENGKKVDPNNYLSIGIK